MEMTWFWIRLLGALLLIGLIPALVVTSMLTPPPDDDKTPPSMMDDL
jgi:hypothetical protein